MLVVLAHAVLLHVDAYVLAFLHEMVYEKEKRKSKRVAWLSSLT